MIETVRLYVETVLGLALMAALAIIAALGAAALTGDRTSVITTGVTVFLLIGAVFAFRLWWRTSKPALPLQPNPD